MDSPPIHSCQWGSDPFVRDICFSSSTEFKPKLAFWADLEATELLMKKEEAITKLILVDMFREVKITILEVTNIQN